MEPTPKGRFCHFIILWSRSRKVLPEFRYASSTLPTLSSGSRSQGRGQPCSGIEPSTAILQLLAMRFHPIFSCFERIYLFLLFSERHISLDYGQEKRVPTPHWPFLWILAGTFWSGSLSWSLAYSFRWAAFTVRTGWFSGTNSPMQGGNRRKSFWCNSKK